MPRLRLIPLLALALLAPACDRAPSSTAAPEVRGEWLSVLTRPDVRVEDRLSLGQRGTYLLKQVTYGGNGFPLSVITQTKRFEGHYRVSDGRLELRIQRWEEHQPFSPQPNTWEYTYPLAKWTDAGTLRVESGQLVHTYVAAPTDAPQTYVVTYQRVE